MKKYLIVTTLAIGALIGASALSALAANWTAPSVPPPGNNVAAPINVGSSNQAKAGSLALGTSTVPASPHTLDVNGGVVGWSMGSWDIQAYDRFIMWPNSVNTAGYVNPATTPITGKVLTAGDEYGTAKWVTPSGGGGGGGGAVSSVTGGTGISVAPTTGNVVVTNTGVTSATGSNGITVSPTTGAINISLNAVSVQQRVTGVCGAGSAIRSINADGTVVCQPVSTTPASCAYGSKLYGAGMSCVLSAGGDCYQCLTDTFGITSWIWLGSPSLSCRATICTQ